MMGCPSVLTTLDRHVTHLICKTALSLMIFKNTLHQSLDHVQGSTNLMLVDFLEMGLSGSGAAATLLIRKDT